jgi:hypothetical protein
MAESLGPSPWPDCGTLTAARRHNRRHEPACHDCRQAEARNHAERSGTDGDGAQTGDFRAVRNGLPMIPGYAWHARTYPWARRVWARLKGGERR